LLRFERNWKELNILRKRRKKMESRIRGMKLWRWKWGFAARMKAVSDEFVEVWGCRGWRLVMMIVEGEGRFMEIEDEVWLWRFFEGFWLWRKVVRKGG
jgi:hypothetical protein